MNQIVVGMADLRVSSCPDDVLVTYSLGSCLGVSVYDPVSRVGGLLHVMLPTASLGDRNGAPKPPETFVDTGLPRLFHASYAAGAKKSRLVVKVAGGASLQGAEEDRFRIGVRNFQMVRKLLWKNGVLLRAYDVGGHGPRTMSLHIDSGIVVLRSSRHTSWEL